jgi:hypothetical protein
MVELVLNQAVVKFCPINKVKRLAEVMEFLALDSQFFAKAPGCRLKIGFSLSLVAAAGVSPEQGRVVLAGSSLLEQGLAFGVDQKDREGTVKKS